MDPSISIIIYSIVYFLSLVYISPVLDHIFTDLKTDVERGISKTRIMIDIVCHLVTIVLFLYVIHLILKETMQKYIPVDPYTDESINLVCGLALVGLQRNLIDKMKYLTGEYRGGP